MGQIGLMGRMRQSPRSYWKCFAAQEPERVAVIHWVEGEEPWRWLWGPLGQAAAFYAGELKAAGLQRGDVCALIIRHHRNFYPIYMAISLLGGLPTVLAYPTARLHPEKFRQGLEGMAGRSGLDWILTERDLEEVVSPLVKGKQSTVRDLLFPLEWTLGGRTAPELPQVKVDPEEACLLQHSSGTTGLQKAVALSHRAVLEHVRRYGDAIGITPADRVVSWLPLYHDMGLIAAFYMPLTLGIPVIQLDPLEWVRAPVILLKAISQEKATLAWLPNFAYNLMADRISDADLKDIDLESLRMLVNCSEPVRAESHDRFYRRFSKVGLGRESLGACYAMAETTFAVTQTAPGTEAKRLSVDRNALARGNVRVVRGENATSRVCVSSGRPISGCEVRVVDSARKDQAVARVGEIAIRSVSLFNGYSNNSKATKAVLKDGWYYSGDYGFAHDGEYFVVGRKKDIIIVAGTNIYPEDIEDAINYVKDVIPGRVVAFGTDEPTAGTEQICVVVETHLELSSERELEALRLQVREAGTSAGFSIVRVYVAPPRWLIKSSSGKPARQANKERAVAELGC